jgi:hypothetical protein
MEISDFNKTRFGSGMKVLYDGFTYKIIEVNFTESLLGIQDENNFDDVFWVRCENVEVV